MVLWADYPHVFERDAESKETGVANLLGPGIHALARLAKQVRREGQTPIHDV